jgi:hypothetical protein
MSWLRDCVTAIKLQGYEEQQRKNRRELSPAFAPAVHGVHHFSSDHIPDAQFELVELVVHHDSARVTLRDANMFPDKWYQVECETLADVLKALGKVHPPSSVT